VATFESDRSIPATPAQSQRVDVAFHGRDTEETSDLVTVEEPMEIRLGVATGEGTTEQSISVTMRTPGDDFDLAIGFLYTEGVIRDHADIDRVEYGGPPSPDKGLYNVVKVTLADKVRFDAAKLVRHFFTSSSCGICGKASLNAVRIQLPEGEREDFELAAGVLQARPEGTLDRWPNPTTMLLPRAWPPRPGPCWWRSAIDSSARGPGLGKSVTRAIPRPTGTS